MTTSNQLLGDYKPPTESELAEIVACDPDSTSAALVREIRRLRAVLFEIETCAANSRHFRVALRSVAVNARRERNLAQGTPEPFRKIAT